MGQKVNPHVVRLGHMYTWNSRWFDHKNYKDVLLEDYKLRKALMDKLKYAGIAQVEIERSINNVLITLHVSRPGIVIGRAGTGLEDLKKYIVSFLTNKADGRTKRKIDIKVEPIQEPNLDAYLVARGISDQLNRRLPFKRVLSQTADKVMNSGAKGVRVVLSGRVGGAEIGRREKIQVGTVPLSTLRENISFSSVPALTKKGYVGIKVWIHKGEA